MSRRSGTVVRFATKTSRAKKTSPSRLAVATSEISDISSTDARSALMLISRALDNVAAIYAPCTRVACPPNQHLHFPAMLLSSLLTTDEEVVIEEREKHQPQQKLEPLDQQGEAHGQLPTDNSGIRPPSVEGIPAMPSAVLPLPALWTDAARKGKVVEGFLPFKTPIGDGYGMDEEHTFTPEMITYVNFACDDDYNPPSEKLVTLFVKTCQVLFRKVCIIASGGP
ncbi:hypothetical protein HK101_006191 [Irineochytrium annulatum]|nr:hypothetical protein HK101_006191 [Irineochytrium annulatum]